jgi:HEAT repeat protein
MVRREAIVTLVRYREKADKFLEPAVKLLSDSDRDTRSLALGLVRGLGPKAAEAVPAVIGLTKDPDPKLRISAIGALAVLGPPTPETIQALEESIHDEDVNIRGAAVRTLRTLGTSEPSKVVPVLAKAEETEKDEGLKRSIIGAISAVSKKKAQRSTKPGQDD